MRSFFCFHHVLFKRLVLCLFLSLFFIPMALHAAENPAPPVDQTKTLSLVSETGRHPFHVELALTKEQQTHGLMNRTKMSADEGMLFFFGTPEIRTFWMRDTLIPLDMLFIGVDGTILKIHEKAQPRDVHPVSSDQPCIAVLEVLGGTAERLQVKAGQKVHHIFFGNSLAE